MAKNKTSGGSGTLPPGNTGLPTEFIFRDQRRRWSAGERIFLETYLERNPHWHFSTKELLDLIYHEILVREGKGELATLEEYVKRFPHLQEDLKLHFEIHCVLSSIDDPEDRINQTEGDHNDNVATSIFRTSEIRGPIPQFDALEKGRYTTTDEIARGGMGAILRALDCKIRREVAVKYLLDQSDGDKKARFISEAQITGQLEHPNIVPVHDLGIDSNQRLFFAMKMVKGRSLAEILDAYRRDAATAENEWPLARLLKGFVGVCYALAYAHARGVIHRDVKPANIMLGEFGEVYLMDWGLAKVLENMQSDDSSPVSIEDQGRLEARVSTDQKRDVDLTREGSVVGTLVYMSPEQAQGKVSAIDGRTDIYSLGAILYELLALQTHMDKTDDDLKMLTWVMVGKFVPPEKRNPLRARAGKIPRELSAIAMKALTRNPDERYQTVAELQRDIERYQEGRSVSAKEDTFREILWKLIKRNRGASIVALVSLLVLISVILVSFRALNSAWVSEKNANDGYRNAELERQSQAIQSMPAYLRAAKLAISNREYGDALLHANTVIAHNPNSGEAHYFKALILTALQRFPEATSEFEWCGTNDPDDRTRKLAELCRKASLDQPAILQEMADILRTMNAYPVDDQLYRIVEKFVHSQQELCDLYQKRIEAAWPGLGKNLTINKKGQFKLDLQESKDVHDLSPIKDMKLGILILRNCDQIRNLSPLKGMNLVSLDVSGCPSATDLRPLLGMELQWLDVSWCIMKDDLRIVKNFPLQSLTFKNCNQVDDLSFLEGLKLTSLDFSYCTRIRDLAPLREMPLNSLSMQGCEQIQDFSSLEEMPLKTILLPSRNVTPAQADVLHRLKSLETVRVDFSKKGQMTAEEFWERYDAGEFKKR